ncbi:MAG: methyltransferase domain-containing protein [Chloroherpetonaceae bacterium]|nr:class I SAM-dependent methyltransferase [bacterium]
MNFKLFRIFPQIDTRTAFVSHIVKNGSLLDIGSSEGLTLGKLHDFRPDLKLFATDIEGKPENYPDNCTFSRCDIQKDKLPIPDETIDGITCMQLIEHISEFDNLISEVHRLLKTGSRIYFETPHPKSLTMSSPKRKMLGEFTLNFYDDPTHIQPIILGRFAQLLKTNGFKIIKKGIARNWIACLAYPIYLFLPPSRKKYISYTNFIGWSVFLIVEKI